jgi:hypothetical protein
MELKINGNRRDIITNSRAHEHSNGFHSFFTTEKLDKGQEIIIENLKIRTQITYQGRVYPVCGDILSNSIIVIGVPN